MPGKKGAHSQEEKETIKERKGAEGGGGSEGEMSKTKISDNLVFFNFSNLFPLNEMHQNSPYYFNCLHFSNETSNEGKLHLEITFMVNN